jgi:class 3 adenylate cyclase
VKLPEIRYAKSGDVFIAYQVTGEDSGDLVYVHGFAGNLQADAESPHISRFYERLSLFSRLVIFDRRGTGLSDRLRDVPTLETRMDDLRAVLDAAESSRAVLFGTFEAASMCMLFAATYPERVQALVLYNPVAKGTWSPDYPWANTPEEWRRQWSEFAADWGTYEEAARFIRDMAPSYAEDEGFIQDVARLHRLSASPGAIVTIQRMAMDVDVRDILPAIRVPVLVFNMPARRQEAEYVAARIPGARRVEVPGPDFLVYLQREPMLPELERFLRSVAGEREPNTVLATVLFTDIVGSTAKAAELGDARWAELVERHHALVRRHLDRFRGREIDTAGDGFFAAFDGPIRAIRCACAILEAVRELGLQVRAGLHTGECETMGEKIGGIAVNIGARVAAQARPGEVLVSTTVKDLVAGSGIAFSDRGTVELKGVPGEWRLFAVTSA